MLVYWLWLTCAQAVSAKNKQRLLKRFSDPKTIYQQSDFEQFSLSPKARMQLEDKDLTAARRLQALCEKEKIHILTCLDEGYPSRLRDLEDAPAVLFYKGTLPDFSQMPAIGVVGTRKATAYGIRIAQQLSRQIAACGGMIVSGGAFGVDTAALQSALDAGVPAVAVLGSGVDVVYPASNRALFARLAEKGCLMSEYLPGTPGSIWQFPARNRIISGLSNGVLVVEAPKKSGALITARDALKQNREVFVVPANIDMPSCEGSNQLLQEKARAVFNGWDVIKHYAQQYPSVAKCDDEMLTLQQAPAPEQIAQVKPAAAPKKHSAVASNDKNCVDNPDTNAYIDWESLLPDMDPVTRQLVAQIDFTPRFVDDVLAQVDAPSGVAMSRLSKLAMLGFVNISLDQKVTAKQ